MTLWAIRINRIDEACLAEIRHHICEVAFTDEFVWLRGHHKHIPADILSVRGQHFERFGDGKLVERGRQVPSEQLPDVNWKAITEVVTCELPSAAIALQPENITGLTSPRVSLQLIASGSPMPCEGLMCQLHDLETFVNAAAEVRFKNLSFAVSNGQEAFIIGSPLPTIRGQLFVMHRLEDGQALGVPAGQTWQPAVDLKTVLAVIGGEQSTTVWINNQQQVKISNQDFVVLSRSAVRATMKTVATEGLFRAE